MPFKILLLIGEKLSIFIKKMQFYLHFKVLLVLLQLDTKKGSIHHYVGVVIFN